MLICLLHFSIWIAQSILLNKQLTETVRDGNCDEIRRLVKEGADKNCKNSVREKSKFCFFCIELWFNLSLLHPVFVCYLLLYIKIIIKMSLCPHIVWSNSIDVGVP